MTKGTKKPRIANPKTPSQLRQEGLILARQKNPELERDHAIFEMARRGVSHIEIAEKFDLDEGHVKSIVRIQHQQRFEVTREEERARNRRALRAKVWRMRCVQSLSFTEIGRRLGMRDTTAMKLYEEEELST